MPLDNSRTIKIPTEISRPRGAYTPSLKYKERVFDAPLSWRKAWKLTQEFTTKRVKSKETYWRLSCHPNSTLTVNAIKGILAGWEREGWVPDIVIIDYADILTNENSRLDARDQINERWKQLRALSQSLHCLVLTVTQTDAAAYKTRVITRSNFSDDKRKLAHVTGMVGLNQTDEEKELGVMRLNWVVRREGAFTETTCVNVAGCLALGTPAIVSCW